MRFVPILSYVSQVAASGKTWQYLPKPPPPPPPTNPPSNVHTYLNEIAFNVLSCREMTSEILSGAVYERVWIIFMLWNRVKERVLKYAYERTFSVNNLQLGVLNVCLIFSSRMSRESKENCLHTFSLTLLTQVDWCVCSSYSCPKMCNIILYSWNWSLWWYDLRIMIPLKFRLFKLSRTLIIMGKKVHWCGKL